MQDERIHEQEEEEESSRSGSKRSCHEISSSVVNEDEEQDEEDSDYMEDDDDDDDDDDEYDGEIDVEVLVNFLGYMHEQEYSEDDENDDDDDETCDCPNCQDRRARDADGADALSDGHYCNCERCRLELELGSDDDESSEDSMPALEGRVRTVPLPQAAAANAHQQDSDDDDDDDDDDDSLPPLQERHTADDSSSSAAPSDDDMPPLEDQNGNIEGPNRAHHPHPQHDDDDDDDKDNPLQCTICWERPQKRNPFVVLPCCGKDGTEETSSMRFCQKCIIKTVRTQHDECTASRFGRLAFFLIPRWAVGECPRCRALLAVPSESSSCSSVNNNNNSIVRQATFDQAVKFAMAADDVGMKYLLFTIGFAHDANIPLELLCMDTERAHKLRQWRILSTTSTFVTDWYRIDPEANHSILNLRIARLDHVPGYPDERRPQEDLDWNRKLHLVMCSQYGDAIRMAFQQKSIRKIPLMIWLLHQGIITFWKAHRFIPREFSHEFGRLIEIALACFNTLTVFFVLVVVLIVGSLGGAGYGLLLAFSWAVRTSRKGAEGKKRLTKAMAAVVGILVVRFYLGVSLWRVLCATLVRASLGYASGQVHRRYSKIPLDVMNMVAWAIAFWYLYQAAQEVAHKDDENSLAGSSMALYQNRFVKVVHILGWGVVTAGAALAGYDMAKKTKVD